MSQPLTPPPDTVDWAEVLSRPCAECGFDASSLVKDEFPTLIATLTDGVAARLARPGDKKPQDRILGIHIGLHIQQEVG